MEVHVGALEVYKRRFHGGAGFVEMLWRFGRGGGQVLARGRATTALRRSRGGLDGSFDAVEARWQFLNISMVELYRLMVAR